MSGSEWLDPLGEFSMSSVNLDGRGLLSGQYWAELRIFAEVARARSFNRAAERLGISQPTIARKVRRLQDSIGAQLFVTTTHGVRLTDKGSELAKALYRLDQSLFAIASNLKARENDAEGIVSVSITDGMAAFFAAPAMPAFSAIYPRIQLHLKSAGTLTDLRENGTDMMLTFTAIEAGDCICRRLGTLHFLPVAAESYVQQHGYPTRSRIADHLLVQSHFYAGESAIWRDWQKLCAEGRIAHFCDNSFAYGMLVKAGVGIGLLGSYAAGERDAVALDLGVRTSLPIHAVALRERLEARPVSYVFEWLSATFGPTNPHFAETLDLKNLPKPLPALGMLLGT